MAKPDTILAWYRRLVARECDGSNHCVYPGRPRIDQQMEALILRRARENAGWGYDRIAGAFANLGHYVSDQTVGNILRRYGTAPAPKRSHNTTWKDFIADFFTVEVLSWHGLVTNYVLFFMRSESRRVSFAGVPDIPPRRMDAAKARKTTDHSSGALLGTRYLLHGRDTKFCPAFQDVLRSAGYRPLVLPPRSPNLNAFAERWVRSIK